MWTRRVFLQLVAGALALVGLKRRARAVEDSLSDPGGSDPGRYEPASLVAQLRAYRQRPDVGELALQAFAPAMSQWPDPQRLHAAVAAERIIPFGVLAPTPRPNVLRGRHWPDAEPFRHHPQLSDAYWDCREDQELQQLRELFAQVWDDPSYPHQPFPQEYYDVAGRYLIEQTFDMDEACCWYGGPVRLSILLLPLSLAAQARRAECKLLSRPQLWIRRKAFTLELVVWIDCA